VVRFIDASIGRCSLLSGVEVDLRITSNPAFPYNLFHLTGSLSYWNSMLERAKAVGLKLSEGGFRRNGTLISFEEEEEIFNVLGLDFIPPELRENQGEIEAAETHQLPRLIEDREVKGVFHVHSFYSDGTNSIKAMAQAAKEMDFSYIGLSDHSQSARYAGGLTLEKLKRQWEEVAQVNEETEGFHLFKGTESDILADGSLDYDETILKQFDFVIASVHSHFSMPLEEMTQRVIKALRNPYTTILGHPTGRLLLAREPYAIDMIRIIDEASRSGVAIELNAHPYRLDIDWRLCKYAKEKGVKITINPDAHQEEGLKDTYFGVGIARKGWLEAGDILNTMTLEEMEDFLKRRRPSI
jgi:DNA polymerase (family 10)